MQNKLTGESAKRIYWLDLARVIAIVSITLNHAVNAAYNTYENQLAEFNSIPLLSTVFKTVVYTFSRIGVPLFLMISGALLLKKNISDNNGIKRFYKHNLLPLFITTEIWLFIMFWFCLWTSGCSLKEGFLNFFTTPFFINQLTYGSMWYMPMILSVYLLIPFVCILKEKISPGIALVVLIPLVFYSFVVPTANDVLAFFFDTDLVAQQDIIICSGFLAVVILGYAIGGREKSVLRNIKSIWLLIINLVSFVLSAVLQLLHYANVEDKYLRYEFVGYYICAACIFELLRRHGDKFSAIKKPVEKLSVMAFGIYFTHIIILKVFALYFNNLRSFSQPLYLIILEVVSFAGGFLAVVLLSKIPGAKKLLFCIK